MKFPTENPRKPGNTNPPPGNGDESFILPICVSATVWSDVSQDVLSGAMLQFVRRYTLLIASNRSAVWERAAPSGLQSNINGAFP